MAFDYGVDRLEKPTTETVACSSVAEVKGSATSKAVTFLESSSKWPEASKSSDVSILNAFFGHQLPTSLAPPLLERPLKQSRLPKMVLPDQPACRVRRPSSLLSLFETSLRLHLTVSELESIDVPWLAVYFPLESILELDTQVVAGRQDIPVKVRHQIILQVKAMQSIHKARIPEAMRLKGKAEAEGICK